MGTMKMVRPLCPEVAHPADPPRLRAERGRKARRAGLCVRPTFVATDRPALLAHAAFTLAAEQLESARGARAWAQATIRLRTILAGKDAILTGWDPLPYLLVHHLQIPSLLADNLARRRGWSRIDFNIGKLVEAGGD